MRTSPPGMPVTSVVHARSAAFLVIAACATLLTAYSYGRADTATPAAPGHATTTAADFLAQLPDGEDKRRFVLDCTNCHMFDETMMREGTALRTRASWIAAVQRMIGFAGANTAFPIMGVGRDAGETADWILRYATNTPAAGTDRALPPGARIDEFLLPVAGELPHDVAVLDDGRILVTGMFTHQMWLLDPMLNQWDTEAIPVPNANPRAVDLTPRPGVEGAFDWWVLLGGPHRLARRDGLTGTWTSYPLGVYGHSLIPDTNGRVWFNSHFTRDPGIIGYVDAATGDVVKFEIPSPSHLADGGTPVPYGLRVAPDGSVWGTELRGNRIVRLDPQSGAVRTFDMPLPVSGPRRPDFDADGRFWIPEYAGNALTRFDPSTETFERYPLPIRDALPYVVRIDRTRGRIWIGTGAADAVFMFDPRSEQFTLYPLSSRGALIRHIDINDATGEVWLAYGASPGIPARIARLTPTD